MTEYLDDTETYEVIITDEDGSWISIAEEVDWNNLPDYLEPVESHEERRRESLKNALEEFNELYSEVGYLNG